jgi:hypothetical protein
MKKIFVFIMLLSLNISIYSAEAKVQPCSKTQVNVIKNGYVCTKVGSLYRWATIPKPIITTKPIINIVNSDLALFNNIENIKFANVFSIANNNIDTNSSSYTSEITLIKSPNTDNNRMLLQKKLLEKSVSLWSDIYKPTSVNAWFFTYEDKEWLLNTISRDNIKENVSKHYFNDLNHCANAGVWNSIENNIWVSKNEMYLCIGKGSESGIYNHHVGHEYVHIIQGYIVNRFTDKDNYPLVCWAFEGMPTFYGLATGDISIKEKDMFYHNSITDNFKNIVKSKDEIKKFFINNTVSIPNCYSPTQDIYVAGSLATELLVSVYGHKKVGLFLQDLNISREWDLSFLKIFNLTTDKFYDIVGEYIYSYYNGL